MYKTILLEETALSTDTRHGKSSSLPPPVLNLSSARTNPATLSCRDQRASSLATLKKRKSLFLTGSWHRVLTTSIIPGSLC